MRTIVAVFALLIAFVALGLMQTGRTEAESSVIESTTQEDRVEKLDVALPIEGAPITLGDVGDIGDEAIDLHRENEPFVSRPGVITRSALESDAGHGEARFSVRVTARDRDESRVFKGIHIDLGIDRSGERRTPRIVEVVTDELGIAHAELPWVLEGEDPKGFYVWAVVNEPGLLSQGSRRPLSPVNRSSDEPLAIDLHPQVGGTIRGVVLDGEGRATPAVVQAYFLGADGKWKLHGTDSATAGVGFALDLRETGSWRITAKDVRTQDSSWQAIGTAMTEVMELDLHNLPQDVELRLHGPGVVRGRVWDKVGRPVPGLELCVENTDGLSGFEEFAAAFAANESQASGHSWMALTTDSEGRFTATGLRNGHYVVRARTRSTLVNRYPHELTPTPVPSNGAPLALRFDHVERPLLVVRVRDPEGGPAKDLSAPAIGRYWGFEEEWGDVSQVFVLHSSGRASGSETSDLIVPGKVVGPGEAAFEVSAGDDLLVLARSPGSPAVTKRATMRPGEDRLEIVVDLKPPMELGALAVRVVDSDGAPVERSVSIRVLDPLTWICLLERRDFTVLKRHSPWPARFDLPQGEYVLEVSSLPGIRGMHGTRANRKALDHYRTEVKIRAGEETSIEARLGRPGFIELNLLGVANDDDRSSIPPGPRGPKISGSWNWDPEEQAVIVLRRETGYPIRVRFAHKVKIGMSFEGTRLFETLPIGRRHKSTALPTGRFVLEARMPGGRVASKSVVIDAGATTSVELDLGGAE